MSDPRIYVSGPIKGVEDFQERFREACVDLDEDGWYPVNPCWIEDPNLDYSEYMRIDIGMLLTCEAIFMLPGWTNSYGATVERTVAEAIGLEILGAAE